MFTCVGVMNGPHPYEGKISEGYRLNLKYCKDRYFCTTKFSGIKTRPWETFSCGWQLRIDKGDAGGALRCTAFRHIHSHLLYLLWYSIHIIKGRIYLY